LFLGQTFIQSLRDVGYNNTTAAVCEHVDNGIQAGASEIRVFFHQSSRRGNPEIDVVVYDNGKGMPPHVLQVAMSFGGSMYYENRSGIGRFGVGMKTAALAMGPVVSEGLRQEVKPYNIRTTIISPGIVATELPETVTEADIAAGVRERYGIAIPADAFADMVIFAMSQPENVDINEILFRPTQQDF
jgi:NAD(P)-dependent dehydrogenase (short-subunit alcohol dehydrogenase family)